MVFVALVLPVELSEQLVEKLLAAVGGIMVRRPEALCHLALMSRRIKLASCLPQLLIRSEMVFSSKRAPQSC